MGSISHLRHGLSALGLDSAKRVRQTVLRCPAQINGGSPWDLRHRRRSRPMPRFSATRYTIKWRSCRPGRYAGERFAADVCRPTSPSQGCWNRTLPPSGVNDRRERLLDTPRWSGGRGSRTPVPGFWCSVTSRTQGVELRTEPVEFRTVAISRESANVELRTDPVVRLSHPGHQTNTI